jgi:hypothetical protein
MAVDVFEAVELTIAGRHQLDHAVAGVAGDARDLLKGVPAPEILLDIAGETGQVELDPDRTDQPNHVLDTYILNHLRGLPNDLFSFGTLGRSNLCYKLRTSPFIGLFRSSYLSRLLMHVFDELDRRLISVLREDGRAPISKLGTILGISRATVQSRLDRLIETGAVLGFAVRFRQDYGRCHPSDHDD